MPAEYILDEIGDKQGWNEASKLDMCLQYIENQGSDDAFRDFLQTAADDENTEVDQCPVDPA